MFRPACRFVMAPPGQNPVTSGGGLMLFNSITFLCYFLPLFLLACRRPAAALDGLNPIADLFRPPV